MCGENALEEYLETGDIGQQERVKLIQERNVFPCYFGSALKLTGVDGFIRGLEAYLRPRQYGDEFGARVYKISRDSQGTRLTWMKVTGEA